MASKAEAPSKKKAPPAAVKALQERLAKQRAEEEAEKQREEEERRREEEEKAKEAAEAKRKEDEARHRAEEKKRRDEQRKVDGERKKIEDARERVIELLASTGASVAAYKDDPAMLAAIEAKKHALEEQRRKEQAVREERKKAEEAERLRQEKLREQQNANVRSPIICVMGHVDTGKTKLLDKIRRTNVQANEAGGITQQIGASFFPIETVLAKTAELNEDMKLEYKIPGLLIIDTPGHESFTNLRSRGSSLCDIAILVIDIMHGLEPQTKESIAMLRQRKCPFIVALNKVDRLYDWKPNADWPFRKSLDMQQKYVKQEFDTRLQNTMDELMAEGLNSIVYWKNRDFKKYVSLVPTSAHTGEGIPDLLLLITQLTQKHLQDRITLKDQLDCVILEVKVIEGLGYTIDVILVNGVLREGDTIILGGLNGPIITHIRALLTPQPLREMRVKGEYVHHKEIRAAQGVKINANDLEHAVAGSYLFTIPDGADEDEIERLKDLVNVDKILKGIETCDRGVSVQASTLGSLEALLAFLRDCKPPIPVSHVNIGPIHKKHIMKCLPMLETKQKELAVILAFDVQISKEGQEYADKEGIKIFSANIIYHLFDQFTAYMKGVRDEQMKGDAEVAVFPVELTVVPNCVFRARDPIVLGVEVVVGCLKIGTPLCTFQPDGTCFSIGRVASMEREHKEIQQLNRKEQAAVKITPTDSTITVGRHFQADQPIYSLVTRDSIDALKASFKDQVDKDGWKLVIKLKEKLGIM
eukprot:TRINITY_DN4618_c0_g1_i1.p2 TRINITY_DN4618_c0_g1~~TRINITY_DN4618_c0_g1_i1.p2  ORF type:complete len:765 (+),score=420.61 TRINITY_DN4618_c0_g1_i1:25-2295(+)